MEAVKGGLVLLALTASVLGIGYALLMPHWDRGRAVAWTATGVIALATRYALELLGT